MSFEYYYDIKSRTLMSLQQFLDTQTVVEITQAEYNSLIDEINMLRELVAEITLETDYTALGQQASTYRALNEKMSNHPSYKQGNGWSTREGELLEQLDVLFEAYDNVVYVEKEQFKPVSEMTLEDWQQALEEGWEFEDNYGAVNTVDETTDDGEIYFSSFCYAFWLDGKHSIDPKNNFIVKRIK